MVKEIRELMTNTIESEFQRANVEIRVLDNMSANAPAFGMIGTRGSCHHARQPWSDPENRSTCCSPFNNTLRRHS